MQDNLTEKLISELKAELKSKYPDFRGIYLFGSRARGDYNEDSDYDLALIFDRVIDWKLKNKMSSLISNYMIKYNVVVDNPILSYSDISTPNTPLIENIKNDGIYYGD